jgi:hypothetical protein
MTLTTTAREHQRLLEVAREYRRQGYEVTIEPQPHELPAFLASFRVDMLARNETENVIIEVRTQESLTGTPELDALAQALQDKPSWRLELVVTNPKDRSSIQLRNAAPLDYEEITYRLREAKELSGQEHGEAALLMAWSAIEALLRSIADQETIPVVPAQPEQLTKSLFIYGLLDREQYQTLQKGLQARNTVVHGYKEQESFAATLDRLLHVANQVMKRYGS